MAGLSPADLIASVRSELARLHGPDYARACLLEHARGGWYYLSFPWQEGGRWVTNPITKTFRKSQVLALLDELRGM